MSKESPEVCLISVGRVSVSYLNTEVDCGVCLVAQLCPTLCNPRDCSPQGSSVHGILQARIQEWVGKNTYWGWLQIPKYKELFAPGIIRDFIDEFSFLGMNVLNISPLMWVLISKGEFVFLWWVWFPWPISVHELNLCSCTESDTLRGIWVVSCIHNVLSGNDGVIWVNIYELPDVGKWPTQVFYGRPELTL